METNQGNIALIFNYAVNATKDYCQCKLAAYEMRRPIISIQQFWIHLIQNLQVDPITQIEGAKLMWKIANKKVKLSHKLLYKLSAVCLMLAQKLYQDQNNTLESYSLISGISKKDLKLLQIEILTLLDFDLNLSQDERQILPQWLVYPVC